MVSELVQVQAGFVVVFAADLGVAELVDQQLAGAVDAGAEQMAADAAVVRAAAGHVDVQEGLPVFLGDVAGDIGNLHLLGEGPVHVLLRGRVVHPEGSFTDGPDTAHLAAMDIHELAEIREGVHELFMVVDADDIARIPVLEEIGTEPPNFLVVVHRVTHVSVITAKYTEIRAYKQARISPQINLP